MKKYIKDMGNFLVLWSGQTVSGLGSSLTSYALILWVYGQEGTASSITLLSFFTLLPSIMFSFVAGTLADRWDKKKTMIVSDSIAALGTFTIFLLHSFGCLQIWHLYAVNFLISFMTAFQSPASYVVTSLLVPKEHYSKASGLQSFSDSATRLLTPAIATSIYTFCGLSAVFITDIATFLFAFVTLLLFVKVPVMPQAAAKAKKAFVKDCMSGFAFLREHKTLLKMILYMSLINLLAYLTGYGILPAMVLARTGNNQTVLGFVSSAIGVGTLVGSIFVTVMKPAKKRTRLIFVTLAVSFFLGDVVWGVGKSPVLWVFAGFAGNILVPFVNAAMFTIMRLYVPPDLQGRVFSARDTLQYFTIPLALFSGGFLADKVFEPLMGSALPLQKLFSFIVGTGSGSGMAVIFLFTGIIGVLSSLLSMRNKAYSELDAD